MPCWQIGIQEESMIRTNMIRADLLRKKSQRLKLLQLTTIWFIVTGLLILTFSACGHKGGSGARATPNPQARPGQQIQPPGGQTPGGQPLAETRPVEQRPGAPLSDEPHRQGEPRFGPEDTTGGDPDRSLRPPKIEAVTDRDDGPVGM